MAHTIGKSPSDRINDAAAAAHEMLPAAEAEVKEAQERLSAAIDKVRHLRTVISSAQAITSSATTSTSRVVGVEYMGSPNVLLDTVSSTAVSTTSGTVVVDHPDPNPSAYVKIAAILHKTGESYSPAKLIHVYAREFNERIPQSTLYAALRKGAEKGLFAERNGEWFSTKNPPKTEAGDA